MGNSNFVLTKLNRAWRKHYPDKHATHIAPWRFSLMERALYKELVDLYHQHGGPLPAHADTFRLLGIEDASNDECVPMLKRVLSKAFTWDAEAGGYVNPVCEWTIDEQEAKSSTLRANGSQGGRPRKATESPQETSTAPVFPEPVRTAPVATPPAPSNGSRVAEALRDQAKQPAEAPRLVAPAPSGVDQEFSNPHGKTVGAFCTGSGECRKRHLPREMTCCGLYPTK